MIAITFETDDVKFKEWKYVGGGETVAVLEPCTKKHRVCWSKDPLDLPAAYHHIDALMLQDDLHNAKVHIIDDTDDAWEALIQ
jgi:hypothetical protein